MLAHGWGLVSLPCCLPFSVPPWSSIDGWGLGAPSRPSQCPPFQGVANGKVLAGLEGPWCLSHPHRTLGLASSCSPFQCSQWLLGSFPGAETRWVLSGHAAEWQQRDPAGFQLKGRWEEPAMKGARERVKHNRWQETGELSKRKIVYQRQVSNEADHGQKKRWWLTQRQGFSRLGMEGELMIKRN